jgi:hypothetical protein
VNGKTIEESRKEYEGSGLQALMEASGHEVCPRCYCCDLVPESAPCPVCGGFCGPEYGDDWDDGYCDYCGDDGEVYFKKCIGNCDEHGHHEHSVGKPAGGEGMRKSGIGSHTLPNNGQYDTWLTPRYILDALGEFDLDPCAAPSPRPWHTATHHIELPEDGLAAPWSNYAGRVWLNPPYGQKTWLWMEKMAEHCCGIALIFARTETDVWQKWVWPFASGVLFIQGRLYFYLPDGTRASGNAGGPSALVAYSSEEAEILRDCSIPGAYVDCGSYARPRNRSAATPCVGRNPLGSTAGETPLKQRLDALEGSDTQ